MGIRQKKGRNHQLQDSYCVPGQYGCFLGSMSFHFHKTLEIVALSHFLEEKTEAQIDESLAQCHRAWKKHTQDLHSIF